MEVFSERIRGGRKRLGLTLDEMSIRAKISKTYLWELEGGREPPPVPGADVLGRLADVLGTSMDSLWGRSDPDPREHLHRAAIALEAIAKGAGIPPLPAYESGLCPDGDHKWTRRRVGGPPDAAESLEVVEFCAECGAERADD